MPHGTTASRNAAPRPSVLRAPLGAGLLVLAVTMMSAPVRAEPPIISAEDGLCRAEARARVFLTPDPSNVGLREVGQRLYHACMRRMSARVVRGPRRHRRHHRR